MPVDTMSEAISETSRQTKRNRIKLSCNHCRYAKLKCDRAQPCSQCVKKGRASLCTFSPATTRKRTAFSMQDRLEHLESLVKGVMSQDPASIFQAISPRAGALSSCDLHQEDSLNETSQPMYVDSGQTDSSGQVIQGSNESTYVGATHWAAILDDIEQVKSYFDKVEHDDLPRDDSVRPDMSLVFNSETPVTKKDLLAALPERPIVDRLVHCYFNSNSPMLHIIHKPTFQKNYRKFWADPHATPMAWMGLIYAVMCLATFTTLGAGEGTPDSRGTPMEMIKTYRGCCAQCLILSNYTQPGPYTLETFLLYLEGELIIGADNQMNGYLIVGTAVRLAMRSGLHRDSDNIASSLTPYQAELRRRIWHLLIQIDLLVSFHTGLPPMVQGIKSDTHIPRNLRDEDFDEDTIKLPPSRPETEMTVMSYTLAKGRITRVFGRVAEQANFLSLPAYDQVMALDGELHRAFAAVPIALRALPMELSITDAPSLIIQRYSIALLFHKSRCVLHRQYLIKEKGDGDSSYSQKAAKDAAMELLYIQSEAHEAVQPGRPLCKDEWFISSMSMNDFLLAAMIVYLSIVQESTATVHSALPSQRQDNQLADMKLALERSYRIWIETKHMPHRSGKAGAVLGSMVKRVNSLFKRDETENPEPNLETIPVGHNGALIGGLSLHESIPMLSSDAVPPLDEGLYRTLDGTTVSSGLQYDFNAMPIDTLAGFMDTQAYFDWDSFDNHVRPQQMSDQSWPELSVQDSDIASHFNDTF